MINKANWYDCITSFNKTKLKKSKLSTIDFKYKIENLRLNKTFKQALDIIEVGEYVNCSSSPISYKNSNLNTMFMNSGKRFKLIESGKILVRIA